MKRIFPAVILALLFHVALLRSDMTWLFDDKPKFPKASSVTITMSYRRTGPIHEIIKPPEKIKEIEEKKLKETIPVKVKKRLSEPVPIIKEMIAEMVEPGAEEISEKAIYAKEAEEAREVIEEPVSIVITEAIPLYKKNPEPRYPKMAKKRGYEGTVLLNVLVNENGLVDNIWVSESCGYRVLDNEALKAVKDWTFEPGRRGNNAVEMWVEVPVRFDLK